MSTLIDGGECCIIARIVAHHPESLIFIPFLLLFQVISAAVLSSALRAFWREEGRATYGCQLAFKTVWAALFGGIPFLVGVAFATSTRPGFARWGALWLIPVQIAVWVATFLTVLYAEQTLKSIAETLAHPDLLLMIFGGGLLVTGLAVLVLGSGEERFSRVVGGGASLLSGLAIFSVTLWRLLRSNG